VTQDERTTLEELQQKYTELLHEYGALLAELKAKREQQNKYIGDK
jgi:hypothetical protein